MWGGGVGSVVRVSSLRSPALITPPPPHSSPLTYLPGFLTWARRKRTMRAGRGGGTQASLGERVRGCWRETRDLGADLLGSRSGCFSLLGIRSAMSPYFRTLNGRRGTDAKCGTRAAGNTQRAKTHQELSLRCMASAVVVVLLVCCWLLRRCWCCWAGYQRGRK